MDKEQKKWMFIIIILILILLNIAILINEIKLVQGDKTTASSNEVTTNDVVNEAKKELEQRVANQEENIRIQYYVADFLGLIENQKYDEAYSLLNEDFKNTNFETIEKFKEFCKIYPEKDSICKYSEFDRIGSSVYVITATINQLDSKDYKTIKQTFVVRENNYNDYKISLQMDYSYVEK